MAEERRAKALSGPFAKFRSEVVVPYLTDLLTRLKHRFEDSVALSTWMQLELIVYPTALDEIKVAGQTIPAEKSVQGEALKHAVAVVCEDLELPVEVQEALISEHSIYRGFAATQQLLLRDKHLDPITTTRHLFERLTNECERACPKTIELLQLVATAFVTSVEPERGFSVFKRVYTRLRLKMHPNRLDDAMIVATYLQGLVDSITHCLPPEFEQQLVQDSVTEYLDAKHRRCESANYNKDPSKPKLKHSTTSVAKRIQKGQESRARDRTSLAASSQLHMQCNCRRAIQLQLPGTQRGVFRAYHIEPILVPAPLLTATLHTSITPGPIASKLLKHVETGW